MSFSKELGVHGCPGWLACQEEREKAFPLGWRVALGVSEGAVFLRTVIGDQPCEICE